MRSPLIRRVVIALGLTAISLSQGCSKSSSAANAPHADPAVPVLLAPVKIEAVQREVEAVGTLWGDEDAIIAAKVPGRILAVYKDVGDRATSGEVLARVDSTDYALAVKQKEMSVREALSKVGLKDVPAADYDPVEVPTVKRANLLAESARMKFERTKQLFEQKPPRVTVQDYDDAKTAWEVARSAYDVELLTARSIIEEVHTKQADLRVAEQALADSSIKAPAVPSDARGDDGGAADSNASAGAHASAGARTYAVATRMTSVGEFVKEGTSLFRLVDDDRVKLRVPVPERHSNEIAVGQKARLNVEAAADEFTGEVARINPQIDPTNRTFDVEIIVKNEKHLLHPGAFARARIETHVDPRVVFVPLEAVVSFAGVNKVFVVEDGKAREILVELGDRQGDWLQVPSGLRGDESVVVSGNSKLATGMAVIAKTADQVKAADPVKSTTEAKR
jgi:multidrug efflux pump subunit AcrA (membrane-fusion protein)